jgi:hypothetical protein
MFVFRTRSDVKFYIIAGFLLCFLCFKFNNFAFVDFA